MKYRDSKKIETLGAKIAKCPNCKKEVTNPKRHGNTKFSRLKSTHAQIVRLGSMNASARTADLALY